MCDRPFPLLGLSWGCERQGEGIQDGGGLIDRLRAENSDRMSFGVINLAVQKILDVARQIVMHHEAGASPYQLN